MTNLGEGIQVGGGTNELLAIGGGVFLIPSVVGAAIGAMLADRGDGLKYALIGAIAAPLALMLIPRKV